jgi:hypothetical protein
MNELPRVDYSNAALAARHFEWLAVLSFVEDLIGKKDWCFGWKSLRHREELHLVGPAFAMLHVIPGWDRANIRNLASELRKELERSYEYSEYNLSFFNFREDESVRGDLAYALENSVRDAVAESNYCSATMQSRDTPYQEKH